MTTRYNLDENKETFETCDGAEFYLLQVSPRRWKVSAEEDDLIENLLTEGLVKNEPENGFVLYKSKDSAYQAILSAIGSIELLYTTEKYGLDENKGTFETSEGTEFYLSQVSPRRWEVSAEEDGLIEDLLTEGLVKNEPENGFVLYKSEDSAYQAILDAISFLEYCYLDN